MTDLDAENRADAGFFHGRSGRWIVPLGTISVALAIFYLIFGGEGGARSFGADAFSRSAIGHRALVELLRETPGLGLMVSRYRSSERVGAGQVLLLLEPPADGEALAELKTTITEARDRGAHVVVALPKWIGRQGERRGWVEEVELASPQRTAAVASAVMDAAQVGGGGGLSVYRQTADAFTGELTGGLRADLPWPQLLRGTPGGAQIHWGSAEGSLLVAVGEEPSVFILSDPDLFNTAGLARGDHAAAVVGLLRDQLGARVVVVDETLHGYERRPSPWRALLDMPLLPMTLHAFLLLALLVWAGTARFGRPPPLPSRLPPGKLNLIENTARLLAVGDHRRRTLQAYFEMTVRRTASTLGLRGSPQSVVPRLDRLAEVRGGTGRLAELAKQLDELPSSPEAPQVVGLARQLQAFRREMTEEESTR